ncbi:hypothetical protein C6A85_15700, partial [Mycobacterium sp. ITM-2017-0098]
AVLRAFRDRPPGRTDHLLDLHRENLQRIGHRQLRSVVQDSDDRPELTVPDALEILAMQVQQVVGTSGWSISECSQNCTRLRG